MLQRAIDPALPSCFKKNFSQSTAISRTEVAGHLGGSGNNQPECGAKCRYPEFRLEEQSIRQIDGLQIARPKA
jgi:hypothetical protein